MSDTFFKAWFVFCALLATAVLGVGLWAVISVVVWLVAK